MGTESMERFAELHYKPKSSFWYSTDEGSSEEIEALKTGTKEKFAEAYLGKGESIAEGIKTFFLMLIAWPFGLYIAIRDFDGFGFLLIISIAFPPFMCGIIMGLLLYYRMEMSFGLGALLMSLVWIAALAIAFTRVGVSRRSLKKIPKWPNKGIGSGINAFYKGSSVRRGNTVSPFLWYGQNKVDGGTMAYLHLRISNDSAEKKLFRVACSLNVIIPVVSLAVSLIILALFPQMVASDNSPILLAIWFGIGSFIVAVLLDMIIFIYYWQVEGLKGIYGINRYTCPSCFYANTYFKSSSKMEDRGRYEWDINQRTGSETIGTVYDKKSGKEVGTVSRTVAHGTTVYGRTEAHTTYYTCACCGKTVSRSETVHHEQGRYDW